MDRDFIKYTYIIIVEDLTNKVLSEKLIKCTADEFKDLLLQLNKDKELRVIQHFKYKSDEYYMYREGDDYDVTIDYKNEENR